MLLWPFLGTPCFYKILCVSHVCRSLAPMRDVKWQPTTAESWQIMNRCTTITIQHIQGHTGLPQNRFVWTCAAALVVDFSHGVFLLNANAMPPGNLKCTVGTLDSSKKGGGNFEAHCCAHQSCQHVWTQGCPMVPQPCQYPGLANLTKGLWPIQMGF
jgi:hypothetical protein